MNVLHKLTIRHLALNRRRTVITIIGIVLSVAMVTAVSGMVVSFQDMLRRDSIAKEGLWHVRYTGLDRETADNVADEPAFREPAITEGEDGLTVTMQFARLNKGAFDRSEEVCHRLGIGQEQVGYHNNLLVAEGVLPGPYYGALYSFAGVLLALVAVGSVLVISNAFTISSDQRSRQFGLLKSAGATAAQIRGMVLFEGVALGVVAIPAGILVGLGVEWIALSVANWTIQKIAAINFLVLFRVVVSPIALVVAVVAAILTILLAAWFPAVKAGKVSAVEAIRQTGVIKTGNSRLRVSPLTGKLFGFAGVLAAKTLKRNRGKYRTTIVSLVVSIVLFIGVSTFGQMLIKATDMVYEDRGSNVLVTIHGSDEQRQNRLAGEIMTWDGIRVYPTRSVKATAALPPEKRTEEFVEIFGAETDMVTLSSISEEEFAALCKKLQLDSAEMRDPATPRAILVNSIGTHIEKGRRMSFVPYRIAEDTAVPVFLDEETPVILAGETSDIPVGIAMTYRADALNLIVSEDVRAALVQGNMDPYLSLAVMADDADAFETQVTTFLEGEMEKNTFFVTNFEALVANNRNIGMLVMIFVYGFIAMLSLIGITNVITTISTNIALRRREFAMLQSVGMTRQGIAQMLNYESLLYGVKALAFGIPLGLGASFLMYRSLGQVMDFVFIIPVSSIVISIVAVLALTFATMAYARAKQKKDNIVSALRDEII